MISQILDILTNFIIHTISTLGYMGIVVLMAIESAAIPLPSEVIMPFAGFLVGTGRFNLWFIALAGGVGSAIGSAITYGVGRFGGRPLVKRYGKYILISEKDLDIADKFFLRFGFASTFIGRLLPVVRTFISIPAGIARTPFWEFLLYSFVGSVIWSWLLGYLGFRLGPEWISLREKFHGLDYIIVALIILGAVWWVWRHIKQRD